METERYKLYFGDCLDILPTLDSLSIDCTLADIPYGTTACKWDSVIPFELMWNELTRLNKSKAAICLFGSQPFTSALVMSNPKMFRYEWIWDKEVGLGQNAKLMAIKVHENILVFSQEPSYYFPQFTQKQHFRPFPKTYKTELMDLSSCGRDKKHLESGLKFPTSVIQYSGRGAEINPLNRLHPTQKPVELIRYLIRTYTRENEIVLDFTMGSGSCGVACMLENRRFIGIEKERNYFEIAQNRIESALEKEPLFQSVAV